MENTKPPLWYWLIAGIALLWNGVGVVAYATEISMTAADFARLTKIEQDLFVSRPFWASAAFAVAVIAGFGGALMLLLRKRIAVRLFLLSLIGVILQFVSYFILDGYKEYFAVQGWIMPTSIPIMALFWLYFAQLSETKNILR